MTTGADQLTGLDESTQLELGKLMSGMLSDKKTRRSALALVKEKFPDTPIPEIDEPAALEEKLAAERAEREKLRKEISEDKLQRQLSEQRTKAMQQHQLSDEDMTKMEEMMTKGELPADYRFAPQLYKQQIESATPTSFDGGGYTLAMPADEGLLENEDKWARNIAHQTIDDLNRKRQGRNF